MNPAKKLFILSILILLASSKSSAQFHISTGYELGYHFPDRYNDIVDRYNQQHEFLTQPLDDLKIMHGVLLGLRYQVEDFLAFDLRWTYRFGNAESFGTDPSTMEAWRKNLFQRQYIFSFGLENRFNSLGYGATVDYNRAAIRIERSADGPKEDLLKDAYFSSTFFLSFTTNPSNLVRLSIRPYIQVPWTKFDLNPLDAELNDTANTEEIKEGLMNVGIMFVFLNGG